MKSTCSYCNKLSDDIIETPNGYTVVRVCKDCEKTTEINLIKKIIIFLVIVCIVLFFNIY